MNDIAIRVAQCAWLDATMPTEDEWIENAEKARNFRKWMKDNGIPEQCTIGMWEKYCAEMAEKWRAFGEQK